MKDKDSMGTITIKEKVAKNIKKRLGLKNDKKFEKLIQNYVYSMFYLFLKQYFDIEKFLNDTDMELSELLNKAVSEYLKKHMSK